MKRLLYQLKSIRRDKLCLLTFLLPIAAGLAINLLSGVNLNSMGETSFGILEDQISDETVVWLQASGSVTKYKTEQALREAVNEPSTQMIGVLKAGDGIRTLLSGDELELNKAIADTLPRLYERRAEETGHRVTLLPVSNKNDGLISLLIVITLVTAMFMGCTFNAMNIISEKEDGIDLVNQILPMTAGTYLVQKMLLGFLGGTLSTVLTALVCMRITPAQMFPLFLIILLSAYIAALAGLYIGRFSEGLMVGILYIKVVMILFLAPPIFFWLMVPEGSALFSLSYLLPSSAAFYGLMDLIGGSANIPVKEIAVLAVHGAAWLLLYLPLSGHRKKQRQAR